MPGRPVRGATFPGPRGRGRVATTACVVVVVSWVVVTAFAGPAAGLLVLGVGMVLISVALLVSAGAGWVSEERRQLVGLVASVGLVLGVAGSVQATTRFFTTMAGQLSAADVLGIAASSPTTQPAPAPTPSAPTLGLPEPVLPSVTPLGALAASAGGAVGPRASSGSPGADSPLAPRIPSRSTTSRLPSPSAPSSAPRTTPAPRPSATRSPTSTPPAPEPTATQPADPGPTTDPAPTDPAPTDPAPTDPLPTDPAPTNPLPPDPLPTDPLPTAPGETVPPGPSDPPVGGGGGPGLPGLGDVLGGIVDGLRGH